MRTGWTQSGEAAGGRANAEDSPNGTTANSTRKCTFGGFENEICLLKFIYGWFSVFTNKIIIEFAEIMGLITNHIHIVNVRTYVLKLNMNNLLGRRSDCVEWTEQTRGKVHNRKTDDSTSSANFGGWRFMLLSLFWRIKSTLPILNFSQILVGSKSDSNPFWLKSCERWWNWSGKRNNLRFGFCAVWGQLQEQHMQSSGFLKK